MKSLMNTVMATAVSLSLISCKKAPDFSKPETKITITNVANHCFAIFTSEVGVDLEVIPCNPERPQWPVVE